MNAAIALVALDLDGTLLGSDGRVPEANAAAIRRAQEQGVRVILATGKTRFAALDVIRDLNLNAPGVFSQGLIICDAQGAILREVVLDQALANEVLHYAVAQNWPHFVYTRDGVFAPVRDSCSDSIAVKYDEPQPVIVGPLTDQLDRLQINKILICDPTGDGARRRAVEAVFSDRLTVTQAAPDYVELFPQGHSKGTGVAWLLAELGVTPTAMLAIGDGDNDLEMLRLAGIGVAVANAQPAVKAAADAVVRSNDEAGVAEALARFVLR